MKTREKLDQMKASEKKNADAEAKYRGVKSLPANPERYVRAAMEEKLARDRMELDKIIRGFERSEKA